MSDAINLITKLVNSTVKDSFVQTEDVTVEITSPNRAKNNKIEALLMEDLSWDVSSEWKSVLSGDSVGQGLGKVLDVAESLTQIAGGGTLRQPWFSRELYKGTKPLELQLVFRFMTVTDPQTDVFIPLNTLLSFMYPRELLAGEAISALGNILNIYAIPGPSLFYPVVNKGDYLTVKVGNFLNYDGCFIRKMSVMLSSVLTGGYPSFADVKVSLATMDTMVVDVDGNFNFFQKDYTKYKEGILKTMADAYAKVDEGVRKTINKPVTEVGVE